MSDPSTTTATPAPAGRLQTAAPAGPAVQRQFVSFTLYKLDPAFRRLGDHEKIQARSEFLKVFQQRREGLICLSYSTVGLRAEGDFLLWRISLNSDEFQTHQQLIN